MGFTHSTVVRLGGQNVRFERQKAGFEKFKVPSSLACTDKIASSSLEDCRCAVTIPEPVQGSAGTILLHPKGGSNPCGGLNSTKYCLCIDSQCQLRDGRRLVRTHNRPNRRLTSSPTPDALFGRHLHSHNSDTHLRIAPGGLNTRSCDSIFISSGLSNS